MERKGIHINEQEQDPYKAELGRIWRFGAGIFALNPSRKLARGANSLYKCLKCFCNRREASSVFPPRRADHLGLASSSLDLALSPSSNHTHSSPARSLQGADEPSPCIGGSCGRRLHVDRDTERPVANRGGIEEQINKFVVIVVSRALA